MRTQRGFSLIEFMIAIVLGLIVTDALISLFVGVRSASRTTSGVAAVADSGRFALDTMAQTVRGAGEMACNATAPLSVAGVQIQRQITTLNPGASPLISWAGGPVGVTTGQPIAGYEAVNTAPGATVDVTATPVADGNAADWVSSPLLGGNLDAALLTPPVPAGFAAPVGSPIQGSDILVVNEAQQTGAPVYTTVDATGGGAFTVNADSGFAAGQLAVISNCGQSEVFEVGSFAGETISLPGAPYPGNVANSLAPDIQFTTGSHVALVDTAVFYVGVGADGEGALFEYQTNGGVLGSAFCTNAELVPDVENMQILYGVETAATQSTQTVGEYVTADAVSATSVTADFNGVISVRIALLVASPPSAVPIATTSLPSDLLGVTWKVPVADSRMRKVYDQTIFLRDMSP